MPNSPRRLGDEIFEICFSVRFYNLILGILKQNHNITSIGFVRGKHNAQFTRLYIVCVKYQYEVIPVDFLHNSFNNPTTLSYIFACINNPLVHESCYHLK